MNDDSYGSNHPAGTIEQMISTAGSAFHTPEVSDELNTGKSSHVVSNTSTGLPCTILCSLLLARQGIGQTSTEENLSGTER